MMKSIYKYSAFELMNACPLMNDGQLCSGILRAQS